jgi:hypothetical protein
MSSVVDICNLALSHLGDEAGVVAIDPPDGTQSAAYCGTYYPMALAVLLEMHPWTFATKRVALAEVGNPSPDDWLYAYAIPSTCIRPLAALLPGVPSRPFGNDTDNGSHPYIVEAGEEGEPVLYTNVETAVLRYIDHVTDTARFTPSFVITLSRLLSSYLAGPILKGKTGIQVAQAEWKLFVIEYGKATAMNANVGKRATYETRMPSFIRARGALPGLSVDTE